MSDVHFLPVFSQTEQKELLNRLGMKTRLCTMCGEPKVLLAEFPPKARGLHGRGSECRVCFRARNRARYTARPRQKRLSIQKSATEWRAKSPENSLKGFLWSKKSACKKAGVDFDLDAPFVIALLEHQDSKCALTDDPIKIKRAGEGPMTMESLSIDRIDNSKGYTRDNVQLVSLRANIIKGNLSTTELMTYCAKILEKLGHGN